MLAFVYLMTVFLFSKLASPTPLLVFSNSDPALRPRRQVPKIPDRPSGVKDTSFHGSQFAFFDDIGLGAGTLAAEAAPVFLFSRTGSSLDPCYPESAVLLGSKPAKPNPGTDGPKGTASFNPGADCTNPGDYKGEMTPGNPFPLYVSASWCGDVWKLNYDLYYVHDGNLEAGHKHDWEGVTIVFAKDPGANGDDWWYRAGAQYNHHSKHDWYAYDDLFTVDGTSDVKTSEAGLKKKHPKVYVGFFSHSAYSRADTSIKVNAGAASTEYRSDDWWRLPTGSDFHSWTEIDPSWNYGDADSTPPKNHEQMCHWDEGKLGRLSDP